MTVAAQETFTQSGILFIKEFSMTSQGNQAFDDEPGKVYKSTSREFFPTIRDSVHGISLGDQWNLITVLCSLEGGVKGRRGVGKRFHQC